MKRFAHSLKREKSPPVLNTLYMTLIVVVLEPDLPLEISHAETLATWISK